MQFANGGGVASSYRPTTAIGGHGGGKVKVLPTLSAPVSLSDSATADADKLIEELMLEAERDPGLRELSGLGKKSAAASSVDAAAQQKYQMVKRPYRTQQDMIIKDESDSARQMQHKMFNTSAYNRSRSADTRPASSASTAAAKSKITKEREQSSSMFPPPPGDFKRTASTENFEAQMLGEVVTDAARHQSVKDLVSMIEKTTKSQSANAYVRKWGCDLISPEPHTRNVTYRREKKTFENGDEADGGDGIVKRQSTYNWTKDDEFQRKHLLGLERSTASTYSLPQEQQTHYQQDNSYDLTGGEFRMSSHVTDIDSLLGRRRNDDEEFEVQWPPPSNATGASPLPPLEAPSPSLDEQQQYRQQDFHIPPQVTIDTYAHQMQSGGDFEQSSKNWQQDQQQRRQQQQQHSFQGHDMLEIDKQIKNIQNEFESDLDTLIDTYRQVQKSTAMTGSSSSGVATGASLIAAAAAATAVAKSSSPSMKGRRTPVPAAYGLCCTPQPID
jgi:hypothetical protein